MDTLGDLYTTVSRMEHPLGNKRVVERASIRTPLGENSVSLDACMFAGILMRTPPLLSLDVRSDRITW